MQTTMNPEGARYAWPARSRVGRASWRGGVPGSRAGLFNALPLGALLLVHGVMAFLARESRLFGTLWAYGALLAGVVVLMGDPGRLSGRLAAVVAYIVGAELIWRGTQTYTFWEFGKYSTILLFGLGCLRLRRRSAYSSLAVLYLATLLPSLFVLEEISRTRISFNLSGPVALAVAVLFFGGAQLSRRDLVSILCAFMIPVGGLAALATYSTITSDPSLYRAGLKYTTAGIGPNQVSSVLGLGLVAAFFLFVIARQATRSRVFMVLLATWFGGQALLSFSRGGVWAAALTVLVAVVFLSPTRGMKMSAVLGILVITVVFWLVVVPVADRYTGNMVTRRFSDVDLTGRDKIIKADLEVFVEHPFLGVGPGGSYELHEIAYRASNAHTEFSRLLAEHGLFGLLALILLATMVWRRWLRCQGSLSAAISMALFAWALLAMFHQAMRLSAISFIFGLATAEYRVGVFSRGTRQWFSRWPGRRTG